MTALGRNVLSCGYLNEYHRLLPFERNELEAWTCVSLTSRLSHGIGEEREHLLLPIAVL